VTKLKGHTADTDSWPIRNDNLQLNDVLICS